MRKVVPILTVLIAVCFSLTAQIGTNSQWTWMKGADTAFQKSVYGTRGVPAPDNTPGARDGSVSWKDNSGNLWLFGGWKNGGWGATYDFANDLWKFNPATNQWTWISGDSTSSPRGVYGTQGVADPLNTPGGRHDAVSWVDASGNFWLFGGFGHDAVNNSWYLDDLWKYDLSSNQWTWIKGHSVAGNINGVYGPQGSFGDNYLPGGRFRPSSWTDKNGNLWLFGGRGFGKSCIGPLNDLWEYNPITNQWAWMKGDSTCFSEGDYGTQGIPSFTNTPCARYGCVSWTDLAGNLFLFGGFIDDNNGGGANNELWKYELATNQWTWMIVNAKPKARDRASSCIDKYGNLWLFGGTFYSGWNADFSDLWKYDPVTSTWSWVKGSSSYSIDRGTYGIKGLSSPSNVIGVRFSHSMWSDNSGNLWVFGGSNEGFGVLNDLWKLSTLLGTASYNSTCGNSNGSIIISATYGINFQPSNTFSGLAAGIYTITVKDSTGDTRTTTAIIENLIPIFTASATASTCNNNNGTITINASGGMAPYQYSLDGSLYQPGNIFTGLSSGTYHIYVKDTNDCIVSQDITVTNNYTSLNATPTPSGCSTNNGIITATVAGGSPPFLFSLNGAPYQSNNIFTGLAPNSYTVSSKDANGCILTVTSIVETATTVAITIPYCGSSTNDITVSPCGGTAPYQYSIDGINFQSSNIFTNLSPGTYTMTIKDAAGAVTTTSVVLNNTPLENYSYCTHNAVCPNSNGAITAYPWGGTAPYQYSLDGITYQASTDFTRLPAGNYTVYIKDANGCTSTASVSVLGVSFVLINTGTTNATCNNNGSVTVNASGGDAPYQYSINGILYQSGNTFTGLASGTYTVYVKEASGCISTRLITISNASGIYIGLTTYNPSCNTNGTMVVNASGGLPPYQYSLDGISYQSGSTFTGLAPGSYTGYVKDANGCITTKTATLYNTPGPFANAIATDATCGNNNGNIIINATGGIGVLKYSINGTTYQSSNSFYSLAAGSYTVYVKDANDCIATTTATIADGNAPILSATTSSASCVNNDGTITANATGAAPFQYSINGITYQNSNVFMGLASGSYIVYVKDANGCTANYAVTIISLPATETSGISIYPNPVNNNQFTIVLGNQLKGIYSIRILDMVGQAVYRTTISNTCICCTGSYSIKLPFLLSSGVYNVEIIDPNNHKNVQRLMVSTK
jgi:N-acetylneuraminic acid mutarotase